MPLSESPRPPETLANHPVPGSFPAQQMPRKSFFFRHCSPAEARPALSSSSLSLNLKRCCSHWNGVGVYRSVRGSLDVLNTLVFVFVVALVSSASPTFWQEQRHMAGQSEGNTFEEGRIHRRRNGKLKWKKSGNRNGLHCGLIRQLISNKKLWQASKGAVDGDFKYISCKENVTLWISHYLRSHLFAQCRGGVIGLGPGYMCSPAPAVFVCSFVLRFNEGYAAWLTSKHPIPSSRPFIELFFFCIYFITLPCSHEKIRF